MIDDSISYIKINRFSQTTFNEFELATQNLIGEGMDKMILDLKNPEVMFILQSKFRMHF